MLPCSCEQRHCFVDPKILKFYHRHINTKPFLLHCFMIWLFYPFPKNKFDVSFPSYIIRDLSELYLTKELNHYKQPRIHKVRRYLRSFRWINGYITVTGDFFAQWGRHIANSIIYLLQCTRSHVHSSNVHLVRSRLIHWSQTRKYFTQYGYLLLTDSTTGGGGCCRHIRVLKTKRYIFRVNEHQC